MYSSIVEGVPPHARGNQPLLTQSSSPHSSYTSLGRSQVHRMQYFQPAVTMIPNMMQPPPPIPTLVTYNHQVPNMGPPIITSPPLHHSSQHQSLLAQHLPLTPTPHLPLATEAFTFPVYPSSPAALQRSPLQETHNFLQRDQSWNLSVTSPPFVPFTSVSQRQPLPEAPDRINVSTHYASSLFIPKQIGDGLKTTMVQTHKMCNRAFAAFPVTPYGPSHGLGRGTYHMISKSMEMDTGGVSPRYWDKEVILSRGDIVNTWRSFAKILRENGNKLDSTDKALLAIFLGMPAHIRKAIKIEGGIGKFLSESPWFRMDGDAVELIPNMKSELFQSWMDDTAAVSIETEDSKGEEAADAVVDPWEDFKLECIQEGGYFADYLATKLDEEELQENNKESSQKKGGLACLFPLTKTVPFQDGRAHQEEVQPLYSNSEMAGGFRDVYQSDEEEDWDDPQHQGKAQPLNITTEEKAALDKQNTRQDCDTDSPKKEAESFSGHQDDSKTSSVNSNNSPESDASFVPEWKKRGVGRLFKSSQSKLKVGSVSQISWINQILQESDESAKVDPAAGDATDLEQNKKAVAESDGTTSSPPPFQNRDKDRQCRVENQTSNHKNDQRLSKDSQSSTQFQEIQNGDYKDKSSFMQNYKRIDLLPSRSQTKDGKDSDANLKTYIQSLVIEKMAQISIGKDSSGMVDNIESATLKDESVGTDMIQLCHVSTITDPIKSPLDDQELHTKCERTIASKKTELQKAFCELREAEMHMIRYRTKLDKAEKENKLLVSELEESRQRPLTTDQTTITDEVPNATGEMLNQIKIAEFRAIASETKLLEVEYQSALETTNHAFQESDSIHATFIAARKFNINQKASLIVQLMKYQMEVNKCAEKIKEWYQQGVAIVQNGGTLLMVPAMPSFKIPRYNPEYQQQAKVHAKQSAGLNNLVEAKSLGDISSQTLPCGKPRVSSQTHPCSQLQVSSQTIPCGQPQKFVLGQNQQGIFDPIFPLGQLQDIPANQNPEYNFSPIEGSHMFDIFDSVSKQQGFGLKSDEVFQFGNQAQQTVSVDDDSRHPPSQQVQAHGIHKEDQQSNQQPPSYMHSLPQSTFVPNKHSDRPGTNMNSVRYRCSTPPVGVLKVTVENPHCVPRPQEQVPSHTFQEDGKELADKPQQKQYHPQTPVNQSSNQSSMTLSEVSDGKPLHDESTDFDNEQPARQISQSPVNSMDFTVAHQETNAPLPSQSFENPNVVQKVKTSSPHLQNIKIPPALSPPPPPQRVTPNFDQGMEERVSEEIKERRGRSFSNTQDEEVSATTYRRCHKSTHEVDKPEPSHKKPKRPEGATDMGMDTFMEPIGDDGDHNNNAGWQMKINKKKRYSPTKLVHSKSHRLQTPPAQPPEASKQLAASLMAPQHTSLVKILEVLEEMFPNMTRMSLTNAILHVRTNHHGVLNNIPYTQIVDEVVIYITEEIETESTSFSKMDNVERDQNSIPQDTSVKQQKAGVLEKLLQVLAKQFPHLKQIELVGGIESVRRNHRGSLKGVPVSQVITEAAKYLVSQFVKKESKDGENNKSCVICLSSLNSGERLRKLDCQHVFHENCIQAWLQKRERTCPVCRRHALLADEFPRLH